MFSGFLYSRSKIDCLVDFLCISCDIAAYQRNMAFCIVIQPASRCRPMRDKPTGLRPFKLVTHAYFRSKQHKTAIKHIAHLMNSPPVLEFSLPFLSEVKQFFGDFEEYFLGGDIRH
jgi:hypothetical protein